MVIGGSDAGVSASLRAKELSPDTKVTMLLADRYPNFSICGLPFYLSGEVSDWKTLAHRTADEIEKKGSSWFLIIAVTAIIPDRKQILASDAEWPQQDFFLRQASDRHGRPFPCAEPSRHRSSGGLFS
ncbi:MAG: hypothetical protein MZV70_55290 [Desulfobacterales bacterium]|nr:hypothetical protein [Desulfobacterales bacterium]